DPSTFEGATMERPAGAALAWMTDFQAAEQAGMALRINLGPAVNNLGPSVERLVVVGACATYDGGGGAGAFSAMLDAHHYTRGVSFLAPGSPTNSTPERRSVHSSAVPTGEQMFLTEGDTWQLSTNISTLVDNPS